MVREPALMFAGARSVVHSGAQLALSQKPAFGPMANEHNQAGTAGLAIGCVPICAVIWCRRWTAELKLNQVRKATSMALRIPKTMDAFGRFVARHQGRGGTMSSPGPRKSRHAPTTTKNPSTNWIEPRMGPAGSSGRRITLVITT